MSTHPAAHRAALGLVVAIIVLAALALTSCGGEPLTLRSDGPPPSTFQTPAPQAPPAPRDDRPTAEIVGTVTP